MPTQNLGQILSSYKVGEVKYERSTELAFGKTYENPYYVLTPSPANPDDAHITIWGSKAPRNPIQTVEYTWAGAKHLEYNVRHKQITAKFLAASDAATATTLESLLIQFLVGSQIAASAASVKSGLTGQASAAQDAISAAMANGRTNKNGTITFSLTGGGR